MQHCSIFLNKLLFVLFIFSPQLLPHSQSLKSCLSFPPLLLDFVQMPFASSSDLFLDLSPNETSFQTSLVSFLSVFPSPAFLLRLFEYRGRVSPVPRVVPVKRPRVAVPLVRRVKSLPVKLLARNASVLSTSNGNKLRCEL